AQVHGIRFALHELGWEGLRILLGIDAKNKPLYARQVEAMLRELRQKKGGAPLRFRDLLKAAARRRFSPQVRELLLARLRLVRPWIDDNRSLRGYIKPGRLIQVDIRDEWLDQEQAMMLFALLTHALALHPDRRNDAQRTKLVLFYDEAHKFSRSPVIREQMGTLVRERRHLDVNIIIASQDPPSVPQDILPLLDGIGVFTHESEVWSRCLGRACAALGQLTPRATSILPRGMMWFWARESRTVELAELPSERSAQVRRGSPGYGLQVGQMVGQEMRDGLRRETCWWTYPQLSTAIHTLTCHFRDLR